MHNANHLMKNRQDKVAKRRLQELLDRRRNMMDYLRRTDFHGYKWVTQTYNLPDTCSPNYHHRDNFYMRPNRSLSTKI